MTNRILSFLKITKRNTGEYITVNSSKTEPSPREQFGEKYLDDVALEQAVNNAERLCKQLQGVDREMYLILKIQLTTACRISEILKIKGADILNANTLIIRANKGGRDAIIFIEGIEKELEACKKHGGNLVQVWNYQAIRRKYIKEGIAVRLKGRKNYAVTHVFRYALAKKARELQNHQEALATALKHRGIKTQEYYKK